MGLNGTNALLAGLAALVALGGCQSKQVYGVSDIGAAPFLSNVAPVAYSRVEPVPQPAYRVNNVTVDTVPQPTYIVDSQPDRVRMAEPVVEAEVYSEPLPTPIEYAAPAPIAEPIVYNIEETPPASFPVAPEPTYVIESDAPAFATNTYVEQAPVIAPQPIYASESYDLPTPPAGIEVEIIPPQAAPVRPLINQPGLAGYGEAF